VVSDVPHMQALVLLHKLNVWSEDLLSGEFKYVFERVLSDTERVVTELKIDGYRDSEVALRLGVELKTVKRLIYKIKRKFRLGIETRVDNWVSIIQARRKQKHGFNPKKPKGS